MTEVQVRHDRQRGCGWRKPGGLYLVSTGIGRACGILPLRLERCPVCSCGIKPSRGWTWLDVGPLVAGRQCQSEAVHCGLCGFPTEGRHGLLWIGEAYYPTPASWMAEVHAQGVSRRIKALPKGFELGTTWVLVAHRKVDVSPPESREPVLAPAIFHAFKPNAVEYVVKGSETPEQLDKLAERGITPVRIEHQSEEGSGHHWPTGDRDEP